MTWICKICSREWETIPDGAVELAQPRSHRLSYPYRFADGTVHDLRRVAVKSEAPEPSLPQLEQVQEVLAEPQEVIPVPDIKLDQEIEDEDVESLTPMRMAFNRLFKGDS